MGCCFSATEREERTMPRRAPSRPRDCSELFCDDRLHERKAEKSEYDTHLEYVSKYDELVRNASEKAKEIDENIENEYKKNYNSILYPKVNSHGQSASPDTFYLSSDADYETDGYVSNRPRTYSESKVQSPGSLSDSIPGYLGRV